MTLIGPADLLERAIGYGLESMETVTAGFLSCPTPCADWDLYALLRHVNESVGVLRQGVEHRSVDLVPAGGGGPERRAGGDPAAGLVAAYRDGTRRLLHAWAVAEHSGHSVAVAGHPLPAELVAITGAIEIAVHGWDISVACGSHRRIPPTLAVDLLMLSPLVVDEALRHSLFAAPVAASRRADPSDQLVAFLGRSPAI
jgi:uncharacterized protein (TIGR03086 family)